MSYKVTYKHGKLNTHYRAMVHQALTDFDTFYVPGSESDWVIDRKNHKWSVHGHILWHKEDIDLWFNDSEVIDAVYEALYLAEENVERIKKRKEHHN